jgi:hypothetical protein
VTRAAIALLLAGCATSHELAPDCIAGGEMSAAECSASLDAIAAEYGVPELRPCLSGVTLYRAPDVAAMADACLIEERPEEVVGCYFEWEGGYVIAIRADVHGELLATAWRHEVLHRLSWCATGDADTEHAGEFF